MRVRGSLAAMVAATVLGAPAVAQVPLTPAGPAFIFPDAVLFE